MTSNTSDSIVESYISKYISDIKSQISQETLKYEHKELTSKLQLLTSSNDKMKKEIKKLKLEHEQLKEAKAKLLEDEIFLTDVLNKFKVLKSKCGKGELMNEYGITKGTTILSSSDIINYFSK